MRVWGTIPCSTKACICIIERKGGDTVSWFNKFIWPIWLRTNAYYCMDLDLSVFGNLFPTLHFGTAPTAVVHQNGQLATLYTHLGYRPYLQFPYPLARTTFIYSLLSFLMVVGPQLYEGNTVWKWVHFVCFTEYSLPICIPYPLLNFQSGYSASGVNHVLKLTFELTAEIYIYMLLKKLFSCCAKAL